MKLVILLGPPGCGKGTQSELLEKNLKLKKLSTGDMLRAISKQESELAQKIRAVMEAGDLVPDEFIIEMIKDNIRDAISSEGVILDGFPRTIVQAKALEEMLGQDEVLKTAEVKVVALDVADDILVKRISGRFTCAKCLAGYHDEYKKPKQEGVCDHCGSTEFVRREDDNEETVKNRLKNYNNDTAPIIDFYDERNILKNVDGQQSMDEVYQEIVNFI